jgi:hypothetical protein
MSVVMGNPEVFYSGRVFRIFFNFSGVSEKAQTSRLRC